MYMRMRGRGDECEGNEGGGQTYVRRMRGRDIYVRMREEERCT
jgi:hypothetical protein